MHTHPLAVQNSTMETIKSAAFQAAEWLGHQMTVVKDVVLDAIARIVEAVKPFFANCMQFVGEFLESAKEWFVANKDVAGPVAGGLAVGGFAGLAIYKLFACGEKTEEKAAESKKA